MNGGAVRYNSAGSRCRDGSATVQPCTQPTDKPTSTLIYSGYKIGEMGVPDSFPQGLDVKRSPSLLNVEVCDMNRIKS